MSTLVIDCYDSFTYNLVHYIEEIIDAPVEVMRVDDARTSDIAEHSHIVFSPGPGLPDSFPNLLPLLAEAQKLNKAILGVCLGMQALGVAAGAELINMTRVHHGVAHPLYDIRPESILFRGLEMPIIVGRYHSWAIDGRTLTSDWLITARDADGFPMGLQHTTSPWYGIQFHPESVLTQQGKEMIRNFMTGLSR